MDFRMEVLEPDDKDRTVKFRLIPDPRRYEWRTRNGEEHLYDRFDNLYFPKAVYEKCLADAVGHPIFYQPPKIRDSLAYIGDRLDQIRKRLRGQAPAPEFLDPSDSFLRGLEAERIGFVILSVDLVGSTSLAIQMEPQRYQTVIQTVVYEVAAIVALFHGYVLKYTGDGLIAYFPEPSFITKNDLALDCALTIRALVYEALNPLLDETGLPRIDIRVGLDSGEASAIAIGNPVTKEHKDIIGAVVSLACKIQAKAPIGGVALGETTLRNLHTGWRQICQPLEPSGEWKYVDPRSNRTYGIYKVNVT